MIDIKIIKTEKEYEEALAHIDALMDADPGSIQEEELELFALLVEKYEEEHFPHRSTESGRSDLVPRGAGGVNR